MEAGLIDLERLGERMTRQSLAMKLMENLYKKGVGTNEIESRAWDRKSQREIKKGNIKKVKEICQGNRNAKERDVKYVRGLIALRRDQAKEDWLSEKAQYRELKSQLLESTENCKESNRLKREVSRIQRRNNNIYQEAQQKHLRKVDHLVKKHCTLEQREQSGSSPRDKWLDFISKGSDKGIQVDNVVPIYGEVEMDKDEPNAALMPPNYALIQKIKAEGT